MTRQARDALTCKTAVRSIGAFHPIARIVDALASPTSTTVFAMRRRIGTRIGRTSRFGRVGGVAGLALCAGGRSARIGNTHPTITISPRKTRNTRTAFHALAIGGATGSVCCARLHQTSVGIAVSVFAKLVGGALGALCRTARRQTNALIGHLHTNQVGRTIEIDLAGLAGCQFEALGFTRGRCGAVAHFDLDLDFGVKVRVCGCPFEFAGGGVDGRSLGGLFDLPCQRVAGIGICSFGFVFELLTNIRFGRWCRSDRRSIVDVVDGSFPALLDASARGIADFDFKVDGAVFDTIIARGPFDFACVGVDGGSCGAFGELPLEQRLITGIGIRCGGFVREGLIFGSVGGGCGAGDHGGIVDVAYCDGKGDGGGSALAIGNSHRHGVRPNVSLGGGPRDLTCRGVDRCPSG